MSDNDQRPEHVIAKEYWDGFQSRNASIIVDLMYGQLKSTVTCLTCNRISNAFDPYMSVCLPIIKEEKMEFVFAPAASHSIVTEDEEEKYVLNYQKVINLPVTKSMKIGDIKTTLIETLGLNNVS